MPVIKSAIKKLRQDKKREEANDALRDSLKNAVRSAKKTKTGKSVAKAVAIVDKAAKQNIIHGNKASRLKSSLNKLAKPVSVKKIDVKEIKTIKKVAPIKKAATKKTSK